MTTIKRLAATALTAALVSVPTVAVTSADAAPARAGKSWTTIAKWEGAKHQACKVSIRKGKAFVIYTRLVNGNKAEIGAALMVTKGSKTRSEWHSPLIAKGKTSKTGKVVFPRNAGYTLGAGQFQGQMGDGGPVKVTKIGRC
ncbi:hypothetical protein [Nocardioides sp. URHA0020]|uniref:hypothetical protein n=1 Tax=Nocardioides sp. URHA0020 TaxID=1380392 RepID=UPI0012DD5EE8|nr:hypothetical protein [Nocardioides sp. URHA0020]